MNHFKYQSGFGNEFESEALPGAIPSTNNPLHAPYKLYSEQLSGSAFTAPRTHNLRSWLFRMKPSVGHTQFVRREWRGSANFSSDTDSTPTPNQIRWSPREYPTEKVDFVESWMPVCGAGMPMMKSGLSVYTYAATVSMTSAFQNSDGDILIVPQEGNLVVQTEFGYIGLVQCEIAVIPRGVRFRVELKEDQARGYILEVYNSHFELPDLGPIGT
jgi:homogentisate 1,2-dioxygenase